MRKIIDFFSILFAIALASSGAPPDRLPSLVAPAEARIQYLGGGVPVAAAPAGITLNAANVTYGSSTDDTTVTVTKPTGTVDGDFILAAVWTVASKLPTPSQAGWTVISQGNYNYSDKALTIYYRRASSDPASYAWTVATATSWLSAWTWLIPGVVTSGDPEDYGSGSRTVVIEEDGSTSVTSTQVTTATNGAAVIQIGATSDSAAISATTLTEIFDNGARLWIAASLQTTAGASGSKVATLSASRSYRVVLIAIKPQT